MLSTLKPKYIVIKSSKKGCCNTVVGHCCIFYFPRNNMISMRRLILLFLLLQSIFSKYNGFNIGPVYSTCCGCGCSQKTLSLDQTNWEIGKQNVNVSFERHHFEMTYLWHALNWPYTQVFTFYRLWGVFISLLQSIYCRGLICIIHNDVERTCPPRALSVGSF